MYGLVAAYLETLKQKSQLDTNRSCTKNPKGHAYID